MITESKYTRSGVLVDRVVAYVERKEDTLDLSSLSYKADCF